ncbi:YicC family protein [Fodinisporobacter ferrooxydans]|uniref:YicC family protein n=1 Tax=Fodinisporobacter ferrooxydans TaxID=2901836 RepID=A0ABY4CJ53_9BACL|nr:YicC family protein [Alicyclobacillaceae bacterium MYW30-H2]
MIKSMTGYGRGSARYEDLQLTVEIRTVNHRFAEVVLRMPKEWMAYEDLVKKIVLSHISRGRAEVQFSFGQGTVSKKVVSIDEAYALQVYQAITRLAVQLNQRTDSFFEQVVSFPGVLQVTESAVHEQALRDLIVDGLEEACHALDGMRREEGQSIREDLARRLSDLERMVADIKRLAPTVVSAYRERLEQKVRDLAPAGTVDEQRLLSEVVIFAERSDIQEELVRLHSHMQQFKHILEVTEPVGRKMDFLIQEMNREMNTIGSKANDARIATQVVECKTRLEQLREQVQNIE